MSSICGVWTFGRDTSAAVLIELAALAQAPYGRDKAFQADWQQDQQAVALGGNLLRLVEEDAFDEQPLRSAVGRSCVAADFGAVGTFAAGGLAADLFAADLFAADARLDNRSELLLALGIADGAALADSTLLYLAWRRWGRGCLDHVIGAFSFAVWDAQRGELFAARDHTGECPLFYFRDDGMFALASMPKGLLALPGVSHEINDEKVAGWLVVEPTSQATSFFKEVQALAPGCSLVATRSGVRVTRYWHPSDALGVRFGRDEEYAEAMRELLDRATAPRLRSVGGVCSQLSGGLDSSSVTASAAYLLGLEGRGLTAYTAVPRRGHTAATLRGRITDEGEHAAEVARMYPNVDHVRVDTEGYRLAAEMQRVNGALDEPGLNVVNWLWNAVMLDRARARGEGVMLTGEAGNRTISFESLHYFREWFRSGRWLKLARAVQTLRRRGGMSYRGALALATEGTVPLAVRRWLHPTRYTFSLDYSAASKELVERFDLLEAAFAHMLTTPPTLDELRRQFFELGDTGVNRMAILAMHGVDQRDPTCDKRVYEFTYGVPFEQFIVGGHSRSLVRRAMRGRLPEATLNRYDRGFQGADWYLAVGEALPEFARELAKLEGCGSARRLLDLERLRGLVASWPAEGYGAIPVEDSYHFALGRGMSLGYFLGTWEESKV